MERGRASANIVSEELLWAESATPQSITASAVAATALLLNLARKGAFFQNDADKPCYLKFGSGVSPSSHTVKMNPKDADGVGGSFDLGSLRVLYVGPVEVVWDAGPTGALRVTEIT